MEDGSVPTQKLKQCVNKHINFTMYTKKSSFNV